MNKALKELIDGCLPYSPTEHDDKLVFDYIYIINTGKEYSGFWDKNGYNNLMLIGAKKVKDEMLHWLINCSQYDIIQLEQDSTISIDCPKEFNCLRLFGSFTFTVSGSMVSAVSIKYKRC